MIACFRRSEDIRRLGLISTGITGIAFGIYLWRQWGASPRLLSALFLVLAGAVITIIAAMFSAANTHLRVLHVLYNLMDTEGFIELYEPLVQENKASPVHAMTMRAHLANAYAYAGEFDQAFQLIHTCVIPDKKKGRDNLLALISSNLCAYYLLMEDVQNAQEQLDQTREIIERAKGQKEKVSKTFVNNCKLHQTHLDYLNGKTVSVAYLRTQLKESGNALHKANLRLLLARVYLTQEDKKERRFAVQHLQEVAGTGKNTVACRQAKKLLEEVAPSK